MNRYFFEQALYIYAALHIFSATLILITPESRFITGIISLLWALLSTALALWLWERLIFLARQTRDDNRALPQKLLAGMDRQYIYNQGLHALKSLNSIVLYVFIGGLFYVSAALWSSFAPVVYPPLEKLNEQISAYLLTQGLAGYVQDDYYFFFPVAIQQIAPLVIIGLSFWMAQIFTYGARQGRMVLIVLLGIFAIVFLKLIWSASDLIIDTSRVPSQLWQGYGWGRIGILQALGAAPDTQLSAFQIRVFETGLSGALLSLLPACAAFLVLLRNVLAKEGQVPSGCLGFAVLLILAYADFYMAYNPDMLGLWLSGWSALSILCIYQKQGMRKIYRIYQ